MKKTIKEAPPGDYERISISIPKDLWKFFEQQANMPQYGSRSGYIRWLIVDAMRRADALRRKRTA